MHTAGACATSNASNASNTRATHAGTEWSKASKPNDFGENTNAHSVARRAPLCVSLCMNVRATPSARSHNCLSVRTFRHDPQPSQAFWIAEKQKPGKACVQSTHSHTLRTTQLSSLNTDLHREVRHEEQIQVLERFGQSVRFHSVIRPACVRRKRHRRRQTRVQFSKASTTGPAVGVGRMGVT